VAGFLLECVAGFVGIRTISLSSDMMALSAFVGPILEPPKGARRLANAFGAPFRLRADPGSFVTVHDGALNAAPSGDRFR
jgi:hypothetical protein